MSVLDQAAGGQLADGAAPLTVADVEALVAGTADSRINIPASAWLDAYRLARSLGFSASTSNVQAGFAWDRAVEELTEATAIAVVGAN